MHLKEPKLSSIDLVFRAFSDRTRLRILNLLQGKEELCVCDIIRVIEAPQAKVSRHLAYLRRAGLVSGRKEGLWVYYRLLPASNGFHRKMLECLSCCLAEVPELKRDQAKLSTCDRKADEARRCCP
jgi:ArsR family transcriptional regulator